MEVMARQLELSDRPVFALVRAGSEAGARARLDGVLENLFGPRSRRYAGRVHAVAGDLEAPGLGLSRGRGIELARQVSTIIHSAASVSFTLPLDQARAINLEGTRRMLELAELTAEHGDLAQYGHISTAYVAGTHAGRFGEDDLDVGQSFHNTYERSKLEAEQLVHSRAGIPFTIMRPSIVVGDRRSGWTSAFNVLYWPLRAFSRGLFTAVPMVPSAPVDVVSVDYVGDAVHALMTHPGRGAGETFHLTAGADASTIEEIANAASRYFKRPLPRVMTPEEFETAEREGGLIEGSSAYFPYFAVRARFDNARALARLREAGISVTPLREYLDRLLDFATRSRWGKAPIARVEALGATA
jgi:thioester reductase-like protein